MKNHSVLFILSVISLFYTGCGSSSGNSEPVPSQQTTITTSMNNTQLNYLLSIKIDQPQEFSVDLDLATTYALPLSIDNTGLISVMAAEIPTMIARVCSPGSASSGCSTHSDLTSGLDLDIVIDGCGRLVSDQNCIVNDHTIYTGQVNTSGELELSDISLRVRAFVVTSSTSGYTAKTSDPGLMDANRLLIDLTTGTDTTGSLSGHGEVLSDQAIVLIGTGTVANEIDTLDGAAFLVTLTGTFSVDPFSLF